MPVTSLPCVIRKTKRGDQKPEASNYFFLASRAAFLASSSACMTAAPAAAASAIFLSEHSEPQPGSVVMVAREGTRPLLIEVQALADQSPLGNPRRLTVGLDHNRLAMLLAVLHRM